MREHSPTESSSHVFLLPKTKKVVEALRPGASGKYMMISSCYYHLTQLYL